MADKQQNILIKYDFDTAAVERASAVLSRANQASNTLQTNAQQAGKSINQSFTQGTRSIMSMEIQLQRLKTQIQLATDPKRIQDLSTQYKKLAADIKKANQEAFGSSTTKVKEATSAYGGLITAAKAFITVGLVKEVFSISLEMAKLAGTVEGVERAFKKAIPNSSALLEDLRRATHGTQTDLDLMQKTLQAKNLGIPVEQLSTFFEFAAIRAQQTGVSVEYLTESIVNGLGRKSTRVLDNLGISASRIKDEFHGVSLEQLSVAEVAQGVGSIIREEMTKMGEYVETASTIVQQHGVSWSKAREEAAKALTGEGGLISLSKEYADSIALGLEAFNKGVSVEDLANQKRIEAIALTSERVFAQNALNKSQEENVKIVEDEIQRLTEELGGFARLRNVYQGRIEDIIAETKAIGEKRFLSQKEDAEMREKLALNQKLRDAHKEDIAIDQEILKLLQARLMSMKNINEEEEKEASGIISRKQKEIEAIQEQIRLTNDLNDLSRTVRDDEGNEIPVVGDLIKKLEIAQAELSDLQRAFSDIDVKPLSLKLGLVTKDLEKLANAAGSLSADPTANFDKSIQDRAERYQASIQLIQNGLQALAEFQPPPLTVAPKVTFWDELKAEFEDNWRDIAAESVDIVAGMAISFIDADIMQLRTRLKLSEEFYSRQQKLAGDNARARTELEISAERELSKIRNEIARKEKKARRSQVIIDGAAGVVKAFATAPNIYIALIQAALVAAATSAQVATINRQPDSFAKGVIDLQGPGTTTSDSIPARLSKHESVMTAEETFRSRQVLKDVRARKLDDRILKDLRQGSGRSPVISTQRFDDQRLIEEQRATRRAIQENKPADVVRQGNIVYEVRQHGETLRRKVRAKSINI